MVAKKETTPINLLTNIIRLSLTLLCFHLLLSNIVFGQVSASWNYTTNEGTIGSIYNWIDCSSGTDIVNGFGQNASINWPFNFSIYDNSYSITDQISISTAGIVRFDGQVQLDFDNNGHQGVQNYDLHLGEYFLGQIIALGADYNKVNPANSYLKYLVTGSYPYRILTIEYNHLEINSTIDNPSTDYANMQVSFYETKNIIVLKIGDKDVSTPYSEIGICSGMPSSSPDSPDATDYFNYWNTIEQATVNTWIEYTPCILPTITGTYKANATNLIWSNSTEWLIWNGTNWVIPTTEGYPGEKSSPVKVEIKSTLTSDRIVTLDVSPTYPITTLSLESGTHQSIINFENTNSLNVSNETILYADAENGNKQINVMEGSFTTGSLFILSDNNTTMDASVSIGNGNVNILEDLTMNNEKTTTYIQFVDNGTLNLYGKMSGGGLTKDGNGNLASAGTVNYNGLDCQTIEPYTYFNLNINNCNGAIINQDIYVTNNLILTDGTIDLSSESTLHMTNPAGKVIGGNSGSFVNGKMSKVLGTIGDDFTFPIGKSGKYRPVTINNVSTAPLTWEAEYFDSSPTTLDQVNNLNPTNGLNIETISKTEYWIISDNATGTNAHIGLSWGLESMVSSSQNERENLEVMSWNGTTWDNHGGGSFSTNHSETNGSFISTDPLSFSTKIITIGSSSISNPLPIELINFTCKVNTNDIKLFWSTATETNNDYFEIERSTDGFYFESIINTPGAGNSAVRIDYSATDYNPVYGTTYYRLKQTDYNGDFSYSPIVSVFWNANGGISSSGLNVYPNPYKSGDLMLETKNIEPGKSITVLVNDFSGKMIYKVSLVNPDDQNINLIPMSIELLPQGMYIISVIDGENIYKTILMVE